MRKIVLGLVLAMLLSSNAYAGCVGNCVNGQGTFWWPDGDKYEGEWKDDKNKKSPVLSKIFLLTKNNLI
jgi:hypothetical protein